MCPQNPLFVLFRYMHAAQSLSVYRIDEFDLIHVCYVVLFTSNAGISIAMIIRGFPNCGCSQFEQKNLWRDRIPGCVLLIHGLSMVYPWFIHGLSMVPNVWLGMEPPWFIGWFIGPSSAELRRDTGGCNLKGCCPTFTVMAPLSPGDSKASVFARTEKKPLKNFFKISARWKFHVSFAKLPGQNLF